MSSPQVIKIGNVTLNVAQFLYAEYSEAVRASSPRPEAAGDANAKTIPARRASIRVTFAGGSTLTFHGEDAEELRHQLDVLPTP